MNALRGINNSQGDGQQEHLWQSILKNATKRNEMQESHLLMLGNNSSGKKSLLRKISKEIIRP